MKSPSTALDLVNSMPESRRQSPEHAARLNNLAVAYQEEGRFDEAHHLYQQSLSIWEASLGAEDPRVALSLSNRASIYRLRGMFDSAESTFQRALRIWGQNGWPDEAEMNQEDLDDELPLWAERVDSAGNPESYRRHVRDLRKRVESGSRGAKEELEETIRKLGPWYHNLKIGGVDTNAADPDYPARRWRHFEPFVPDDLQGKVALDIGCDAGFFSLEMKRRGADRVISIDIMPHRVAQTRFASYWFGLPLEPRQVSVYDLETLKTKFDIVMFAGVLYHLKHPLYALEKVSAVCKDTMYFQSAMRGSEGDFTPADDYPAEETAVFEDPDFPKLYFIEKSLNADGSNWWFATRSCLKAMLRVSGFGDITPTSAADHFVCRKG